MLVLPTVLLWPSLRGEHVFLPFSAATFPPFAHELDEPTRARLAADANLDITEITLTFGPEWQHARSRLAEGHLPQWNPHARFGAPLLATAVLGLLYPPNWLTFLAMDFERGLAWNVWLGLAIAGLSMLGFLHARGLDAAAATLGAVAFAWSGTLAVNVHHYQRLHTLAWLPGVLWALTVLPTAHGRRRAMAFVAVALSTAATWLAGFPPYAAAVTLLAAAYSVPTSLAAAGARWRGMLASASALGCGLLLAAAQLVPMLAFFPESNRPPDPSDSAIVAQAFDPMGLLGYVLPHPFGSPDSGVPYPSSPLAWWLFSRRDWGSDVPVSPNYNFIEYTVFPGALIAILATVGITCAGRALPLLGLGTLLLLATASDLMAPLYALPGVRSVPPMRFVGPACALVGWLAALGFTRLIRADARWRLAFAKCASLGLAALCAVAYVWLAAHTGDDWLAQMTPALLDHYRTKYPGATPAMVASLLGPHVGPAHRHLLGNLGYGAIAYTGVAVLLWLRGRQRAPRWWIVAVISVAAIECLAFAWPANRGRPSQPLSAPALDQLRAARAEHAGGFAVIRGSSTADLLPRALPPGLLLTDRIRDLHAYTFVDARSHALFRALYGDEFLIRETWPQAFPDDPRLQLPLWDALGVRYVLATDPLQHAGELLPSSPPRPFYVYHRPTALPRAWVNHQFTRVANDGAAVARMTARDFDPRREFVVTAEQRLPDLPAVANPAPRHVSFRTDEPELLELEVGAGAPGFLVMSDALLSGWTATIDGAPTPLVRGNLFMRVLPLPDHSATVTMRYATPGLLTGALLSLVGVVTVLAACFANRRRLRPEQVPDARAEPAALLGGP